MKQDPLMFPGGAVYTRIVRSHRVQGWQADSPAEYDAAPGLRASHLKTLCDKTPAHFRSSLTAKSPDSPQFLWGRLVHAFILEGIEPPVMPIFKGRGSKAAKEAWLEENGNPECVTEDELAELRAMRSSVLAQPVGGNALRTGRCEVSGYAQTEGFAAKIRADLLCASEGVIYDLKTCQSAALRDFERDAYNYGYHIQAAYYLAVAHMIEPGTYHTFRWICVEKTAPYLCAVYQASNEQLAFGSKMIEKAIDTLVGCITDDAWPGYPADVIQMEVPYFIKRQEGIES